jgi:hypothetical protein
MSSGHSKAEGLVDRIFGWLRGGEFDRMPADEVERMAHDIGLSGGELRDLAAKGSDGADLLYARMSALGVTAADIDRMAFGLTRDLEKDCACCCSKEQCAGDLAKQPDAPGWMAYCANAATLEAASRVKGRAII